MKKLSPKLYALYLAVIAAGIGLDQLTKALAVRFLKPLDTFPLIENILHLTYVENRGAAFGMLAEHRWVFLVVSTVAILAMGFYLFAGFLESKLGAVALAIIISGGIGNMIDRVANGFVVDFIDCRFIDFAVFNGADSFVCVGAGLLILALLLDVFKEKKKKERDE